MNFHKNNWTKVFASLLCLGALGFQSPQASARPGLHDVDLGNGQIAMTWFCLRNDDKGCNTLNTSEQNSKSPNYREYLLMCNKTVGAIPGHPNVKRLNLRPGTSVVYDREAPAGQTPEFGYGAVVTCAVGAGTPPVAVQAEKIPAPKPIPLTPVPLRPRPVAAGGNPVCEDKVFKVPAYFENEEDRNAGRLCAIHDFWSKLFGTCELYLGETQYEAGIRLRIPPGHWFNPTADKVIRLHGRPTDCPKPGAYDAVNGLCDCVSHTALDRFMRACPLFAGESQAAAAARFGFTFNPNANNGKGRVEDENGTNRNWPKPPDEIVDARLCEGGLIRRAGEPYTRMDGGRIKTGLRMPSRPGYSNEGGGSEARPAN